MSLTLKDFMTNFNLKNKRMTNTEVQSKFYEIVYFKNLGLYARNSVQKRPPKLGLINIEGGSQGGTHWTSLYTTNFPTPRTCSFRSFGVYLDSWLMKKLLNPIIWHNYKIQSLDSVLCGTYCLYFLYLMMKNMSYYDAISSLVFT